MTKYVQFSDASESIIVAIFGGTMEENPQSLVVYPYQGEVEDDDPRLLAYPPRDILAEQSAKLQGLVKLAASQKNALSNRIADLEFSIEDGTAAPGEDAELVTRKAQLVSWFRYSSSLGRVTSQAGWYATVAWPVQPATGMDLTVSSTAPSNI